MPGSHVAEKHMGMEGGQEHKQGALSSLEEMHSCSLVPDLYKHPKTPQFFQP